MTFVTALLKVAVTLAATAIPVAPLAGDEDVTVGAVTTGATGVTTLDAAEGRLAPTSFTATTLKVYAVPLVSPLTVLEVNSGGMPVTVRPASCP